MKNGIKCSKTLENAQNWWFLVISPNFQKCLLHEKVPKKSEFFFTPQNGFKMVLKWFWRKKIFFFLLERKKYRVMFAAGRLPRKRPFYPPQLTLAAHIYIYIYGGAQIFPSFFQKKNVWSYNTTVHCSTAPNYIPVC